MIMEFMLMEGPFITNLFVVIVKHIKIHPKLHIFIKIIQEKETFVTHNFTLTLLIHLHKYTKLILVLY